MNGFQVMLMFAQSAGKCFKYFPVQNVKVILLKMQQYVLLVEKKYVLNLWFDRSYCVLSIPFLIIVSAFILTIIYPLSDSTPISK
jgi:hypothetical protein